MTPIDATFSTSKDENEDTLLHQENEKLVNRVTATTGLPSSTPQELDQTYYHANSQSCTNDSYQFQQLIYNNRSYPEKSREGHCDTLISSHEPIAVMHVAIDGKESSSTFYQLSDSTLQTSDNIANATATYIYGSLDSIQFHSRHKDLPNTDPADSYCRWDNHRQNCLLNGQSAFYSVPRDQTSKSKQDQKCPDTAALYNNQVSPLYIISPSRRGIKRRNAISFLR